MSAKKKQQPAAGEQQSSEQPAQQSAPVTDATTAVNDSAVTHAGGTDPAERDTEPEVPKPGAGDPSAVEAERAAELAELAKREADALAAARAEREALEGIPAAPTEMLQAALADANTPQAIREAITLELDKRVEAERSRAQAITISAEELERVRQASTERLRNALQSSDIPPVWANAIRDELAKREADAALAARTSPIPQQYVVMATARYVHGGQVTQLAAGSIVGEHTHDLADLDRQGIQRRPIRDDEEIQLTRSELGFPKVVIVRKG